MDDRDFLGHGVVGGDANAAHGPMTLEAVETGLGRPGDEGFFKFFARQSKGDVHARPM